MAAHQCPRCHLLYTYRTELELHLREDHEPAPPKPDEHNAEPQPAEPAAPHATPSAA